MEGRRFLLILVGAGLASCLGVGFATAGAGDCRVGGPVEVACYARPSNTSRYVGYYVGGGSAVRGTHRCDDEGTWGWDYHGCFLPHRVVLSWSHWRYQGGTGAYRAEGPPVPDVPACAAAVAKKPLHKHDEGN